MSSGLYVALLRAMYRRRLHYTNAKFGCIGKRGTAGALARRKEGGKGEGRYEVVAAARDPTL